MSDDLWITVCGWDKFQHYGNRKPVWIKVYLELLDKDEYNNLTPTACALLHRTWLMYAKWSRRGDERGVRVHDVTTNAGRVRARRDHWKELTQAGFIQLSASKPASKRASDKKLEVRSKETPPKPPPTGGDSLACPHCGLDHSVRGNRLTKAKLAEHIALVHG